MPAEQFQRTSVQDV